MNKNTEIDLIKKDGYMKKTLEKAGFPHKRPQYHMEFKLEGYSGNISYTYQYSLDHTAKKTFIDPKEVTIDFTGENPIKKEDGKHITIYIVIDDPNNETKGNTTEVKLNCLFYLKKQWPEVKGVATIKFSDAKRRNNLDDLPTTPPTSDVQE